MTNTTQDPITKDSRIYLAGHDGMVGSALFRKLQAGGFENIIFRTIAELDLTDQHATRSLFESEKPEYVLLAAARVGGIEANNSYPAEFIYQNLMIEANIIHTAHESGVKRLLFLGSSCIYPRLADQPMREEALLAGKLEPTNEPYAIAKIAGIKLCESYNRQYDTDFRSVMPTNLFGPYDNFNLAGSHVVPAMIRKFHEAKTNGSPKVTIWGTGSPRREFLHVDDMADACLFLLNLDRGTYRANTEPMLSHINIGCGEDVTIAELAQMVKEVVGFKGELVYDSDKPDGTPRKLLDVERLKSLGWSPKISLKQGLESTYRWFLDNQENLRL